MRSLSHTPASPPDRSALVRILTLALILLLHLALLQGLLHPAAPEPAPQAPVSWLKLQLLSASGVAATSRDAAPPAPVRRKPSPKPAPIPQSPETDTPHTAVQSAALAPPSTAPRDAPAEASPPLEYLIRIARLVSRSQRYPWSARQYGQQGDVLVRVHLYRDGRVLAVQLLQSSGVAALDDEACAVMWRIVRFPPFPADYLPSIAEFDLDQPVNFRHYQN